MTYVGIQHYLAGAVEITIKRPEFVLGRSCGFLPAHQGRRPFDALSKASAAIGRCRKARKASGVK